jgi:hypothetical protein
MEHIVKLMQVQYALKSMANGDDQSQALPWMISHINEAIDACAGMADPAAEIADLRAKLDEAVGALESVQPYLNTMLVEDDPDEECVGWEGDGTPIAFTMGQIRQVNRAVACIKGRIK